MDSKFIKIDGPYTQFPSIGECIYCKATGISLTDEHVLPYAIAGHAVVFKKASCRRCAEFFTKEFEQEIISQTLNPVRFKIGAPSRNKKSKPDVYKLPAEEVEGSSYITKEILFDRAGLPIGFVGLKLRLPRIVTGAPAATDEQIEGWGTVNTESIAILRKKYGIKRVYVGKINPLKFGRFLAKIAFSYAIGKYGNSYFKDIISPLLHGKIQEFTDLVGGEYEIQPLPEINPMQPLPLHEISEGFFDVKDTRYLAIRIRLFSFLRTPTYYVVVGVIP